VAGILAQGEALSIGKKTYFNSRFEFGCERNPAWRLVLLPERFGEADTARITREPNAEVQAEQPWVAWRRKLKLRLGRKRIRRGLRTRGTGERFQFGIAERGIIPMPDDDWLEIGLECGGEIFEENAGAVHAGKQHERDH
jgi:hypothetical protein